MAPDENVKNTRVPRDDPSASVPAQSTSKHPTYDMAQFKHLLYAGFPSPVLRQKNEGNDGMPNLSQLSLNKTQNSAHNSQSEEVQPTGIHSVPQELILRIAAYLPQADKCRLAQTCRGFSILMKTPLDEQDAMEDHHALWWACVKNDAKLLKRVLAKDSTLVNYRFKEHHSSRSILQSGAWSKHFTPLVLSLRFGADEVFLQLLKSGVDVNLPDEMPLPNGSAFMGHRRQWMPINWAVHMMKAGDDFDLSVGLLVAYGANANEAPHMLPWEDPEYDPLPGDQMPLFEQLELKLRISSPTYIGTDSMKAMYEKRRSRLISLLDVGADAKAIEPYTSHTTLYRLTKSMVNYQAREDLKGHDFSNTFLKDFVIPHCLHTFEILIRCGAQLSERSWDYEGGLRTPLHLICKKSDEYERVINYFLQKGLDINVPDSYGRTPLYEMLRYLPSDLNVISRFIEKGANVNHRDNMLRTPLHAACADYRGSQEILRRTVKILLQYGANGAATDIDEKTALDLFLATRRPANSKDLVELLRNAARRTPGHIGNNGKAGRGGRGGRNGSGGRGGQAPW